VHRDLHNIRSNAPGGSITVDMINYHVNHRIVSTGILSVILKRILCQDLTHYLINGRHYHSFPNLELSPSVSVLSNSDKTERVVKDMWHSPNRFEDFAAMPHIRIRVLRLEGQAAKFENDERNLEENLQRAAGAYE
jgi:hypothetical protein